MGLLISLLPSTSPLITGGFQGLQLYARIAGLYFVKRGNSCVVTLEYYESAAAAQSVPSGAQVFPAMLPSAVNIPNPSALLDSETLANRAVCYGYTKAAIIDAGGEGTTVIPA